LTKTLLHWSALVAHAPVKSKACACEDRRNPLQASKTHNPVDRLKLNIASTPLMEIRGSSAASAIFDRLNGQYCSLAGGNTDLSCGHCVDVSPNMICPWTGPFEQRGPVMMNNSTQEFERLLGKAALALWSGFPRHVQENLFEAAVAGDDVIIRNRLASYLHDHHPKTAHLAKPMQSLRD
jgi:hypothetical protein